MSTSLSAVKSSESKVTLLAVNTSKVGNGNGSDHEARRTPAHHRPFSSATRPDILTVVHPPRPFEKQRSPILRLSGGGIAYCSE